MTLESWRRIVLTTALVFPSAAAPSAHAGSAIVAAAELPPPSGSATTAAAPPKDSISEAAASDVTAPQVERIAITQFEVSGTLDPGMAAQVSARVAQTIGQTHHTEVITPDEIGAMLQHEVDKQQMGCEDQDSCMAEIAGALGAAYLITGRITRTNGGITLSLAKLDSRSAKVITRLTEKWGGPDLAIVDLAAAMADKLQHPEATGSLEVVGAVVGSQVLIDDHLRAGAPANAVVGLAVGAHLVRVIQEEMQPVDVWSVVRMGDVTSVAVSQQEAPRSLTSRWWFWTAAIGGVAALGAGVGTGIYLSGQGGNGSGATGVNVSVNANEAFGGGR